MRWRSILVLALAGLLLLAGSGTTAFAENYEANDVAFTGGLQWSLEQIGAPGAWNVGRGEGVRIAVVDSGIDFGHVDLKAKVDQVNSIACFGTNGDPGMCKGSAQDDHGHGTHVAGIAAATTRNRAGIAGTAPGAELMAIKVLRKQCDGKDPAVDQVLDGVQGCTASGASSDVVAGIRWAADHGADVINLSLGSTTNAVLGSSFSQAIQYAWDSGAIPVVAAGNDFVLSSGFADEPAVVVAATNRDRNAASYSNGVGNARWGVSAPGGEGGDDDKSCSSGGEPLGILSTYWIDGHKDPYACLAGTSMAAPHVSGALAVLLGQGLSQTDAVERLLTTSVDLGAEGPDTKFGAGLIDLAAAVQGLPDVPPPTAPPPTASAAEASEPAAPAVGPDLAPTTAPAEPSPTTTEAPPSPDVNLPEREHEAALGDLTVTADEARGQPSAALVLAAGLLAVGVGGSGAIAVRRGALSLR